MPHCRCSPGSLACKQINAYVERQHSRYHVINDMEFRIVSEGSGSHQSNSNSRNQGRLHRCINCSIIRTSMNLPRRSILTSSSMIVVRVLYVYHALRVQLWRVSTADTTCFPPCARVILPSVSSLECLPAELRNAGNAQRSRKLCTRSHKIDSKGLSILTAVTSSVPSSFAIGSNM